VYGVCSPEGVLAGQSARVLFDSDCQFNRTHRSPIVGPGSFRRAEVLVAEVTVTVGGCQRCSHLGIGQSTCHRGVAAIPELDGEVRACLFYQELHEGTGVEVDEGHSSAPLLADYVGQRPARSASDPPGSAWTSEGFRWGYQPIRDQPLQSRGSAQPPQACHGDTTVSDYDLITTANLFEPAAQMGSKLSDSDVHGFQCTPRPVRFVQLSPIEAKGPRIGRLRVCTDSTVPYEARQPPRRRSAQGRRVQHRREGGTESFAPVVSVTSSTPAEASMTTTLSVKAPLRPAIPRGCRLPGCSQ
jgi:hypothetical protein